MNKKIISLAIAAAVAAPMAAQADVKISGSVARDLWSSSSALAGGDMGTSKLNIDASEGDAFLRMAWDIRAAAINTAATASAMIAREQYAGIKLGGGKLSVGRTANQASKVIYGADRMNATFLEARGAAGATDKVASFDSGTIGFDMKVGDVDFGINYGPAYKDMYSLTNIVNAMASFKAGPVALKVGYDTSSANANTTAVSAGMKFGEVDVTVLAENSTNNIIFADVSMPLGGMTVGLGIGSDTTASQTFSRLSVEKKMGKAKVYAGVSDAAGTQKAGAGLRVDI
jgi:hypothetical protein